jgi:hypothetical protein
LELGGLLGLILRAISRSTSAMAWEMRCFSMETPKTRCWPSMVRMEEMPPIDHGTVR